MIVLVDNYDSFTFNLEQYLSEYTKVSVIRNDDPKLLEAIRHADGIVLSPGPGHPSEANLLEKVIQSYQHTKPILGICLGHQALGEVNGGKVARASQIRHGKVSMMQRIADPLFADIPEEFPVMRYHSLIVEKASLPKTLILMGTALDDGEMMAMKLQGKAVYGLQFHPESIGSPYGKTIIRNFVTLVKDEVKNNGKFITESL